MAPLATVQKTPVRTEAPACPAWMPTAVTAAPGSKADAASLPAERCPSPARGSSLRRRPFRSGKEASATTCIRESTRCTQTPASERAVRAPAPGERLTGNEATVLHWRNLKHIPPSPGNSAPVTPTSPHANSVDVFTLVWKLPGETTEPRLQPATTPINATSLGMHRRLAGPGQRPSGSGQEPEAVPQVWERRPGDKQLRRQGHLFSCG